MSNGRRWRGAAVAALLATLLGTTEAVPQQRLPAPQITPKFVPKFEAVAETRLLMEGLATPNYRSLERFLKEKPADVETWAFARGQALLIAETGNLLLLRPPRNTGRDTWMRAAMDMRSAAATLARSLGNRDLTTSRHDLAQLARACDRCHQTFRVPVRIAAPSPTPARKGT